MPQPINQVRRKPVSGQLAWVVVADAGRARIFAGSGLSRQLVECFDLINPEARLKDHDALADRRGHVANGPSGIGHAFEPRETHGEHIAESFARDLCQRLDAAQRSGHVHRIYLIAAPAFLGLMRSHLEMETLKIVVKDFAMDLSRHPVSRIRDTVPAYL